MKEPRPASTLRLLEKSLVGKNVDRGALGVSVARDVLLDPGHRHELELGLDAATYPSTKKETETHSSVRVVTVRSYQDFYKS